MISIVLEFGWFGFGLDVTGAFGMRLGVVYLWVVSGSVARNIAKSHAALVAAEQALREGGEGC